MHPTVVVRAGNGQSPWHRVSTCWIFDSYLSIRDDPRIGLEKGAGLAWGRGNRRCKGRQVRITQEIANGARWVELGSGESLASEHQGTEFRGLTYWVGEEAKGNFEQETGVGSGVMRLSLAAWTRGPRLEKWAE